MNIERKDEKNESVNGKQSQNDVSKRRTLVSAKKMNQILKTGTDAYIAVFLPSTITAYRSINKDEIAANEGKGTGTQSTSNCRNEGKIL